MTIPVARPEQKARVSSRTPRGNPVSVTGPSTALASGFGSIHSVLHSTAFVFAENMLGLLVVVFWLGIAWWVLRDARRRVDDPWLVALAALVALAVPFVGALVYLVFRSPETLADLHAREIELLALTSRIEQPESRCPVCRTHVEPTFLACPMCTSRLKQSCRSCTAPLDPLWQMCPYCATSVRPPLEPVSDDLDAALTAEAVSVTPKAKPARQRKQRGAAA